MRVLIESPAPRHAPVAAGLQAAFAAAGFECSTWGGDVPAFDAFDEARPDLYVRTRVPTRSVSRALARRPRCKVIDRTDPRPGFDCLAYRPAEPDPDLACDVAFFGSYREDKKDLLDSYILPLCDQYRVKLFGAGVWPVPEHLGWLEAAEIPVVVASAKVCLNVSAGRPSERSFIVNGLGGCLVGNACEGWPPIEPAEIHRTVANYLTHHRAFRAAYGRYARERTLAGHTYFHRAAEILAEAGLPREAARVLEALPRDP